MQFFGMNAEKAPHVPDPEIMRVTFERIDILQEAVQVAVAHEVAQAQPINTEQDEYELAA